MKKNYIIPSTELLHVAAMTALCESQFGTFTNGGSTGGSGDETNIPPETGGL